MCGLRGVDGVRLEEYLSPSSALPAPPTLAFPGELSLGPGGGTPFCSGLWGSGLDIVGCPCDPPANSK